MKKRMWINRLILGLFIALFSTEALAAPFNMTPGEMMVLFGAIALVAGILISSSDDNDVSS